MMTESYYRTETDYRARANRAEVSMRDSSEWGMIDQAARYRLTAISLYLTAVRTDDNARGRALAQEGLARVGAFRL
jgi:hypothetical protein